MTDAPSSRPSFLNRANHRGEETRAGWRTLGAVIAVVVDAIGTASTHGITTPHH